MFGRHVGKGDLASARSQRDAAGVYHFVSTCTLTNGTLVKSMGTAWSDFSSRYKVHSAVNISGAPIACP